MSKKNHNENEVENESEFTQTEPEAEAHETTKVEKSTKTNLGYFAIPIIIGIAAGAFLAFNFQESEIPQEPTSLFTVQKLTNGGSPIAGSESAPITILEFGDYQCTFCFRFHETSLNTIVKEYIQPGKVRMVFKDFPVNGPDSVLGAEASWCADDQGKYWDFHDTIYTHWDGERTGWLNRASLNDFAKIVGLELDEFNACLDEGKYRNKVLQMQQFARDVGIDATPSFLIYNDEKIIKIRGNQPIEVFKQVFAELDTA